MDGNTQGSRPTVWIAIAAVCALAAIGLGIWAFTTKSDLDDAEAKVDQQQKQLDSSQQRLSAAEQRAARTETAEKAFGERAVRRYRRVRSRLIRERANLDAEIKKEAGELEQARSEASAAESNTEKRDAQLKQARQTGKLAAACARGTVDAVNEFFNASNARAGANAAMKRLEDLEPQCEDALR